MLGLACSTEQKVKVTAAPVTAGGRPARFDGALTVTVQSGDGTFTQDAAEPNSFFAVSGDAPGTTVYLIEADADLGAGVITLQDTVELEVAGVNAASFGLTAGAPEAK
jgi:hypothetical protein